MNRNEAIYKEFAMRFSQLANDEYKYYVEGERQTIGDAPNVFEFRCNISPTEHPDSICYEVNVCIYCESISDNIYAVQKMFDLVAPLYNDFTTSVGCAIRDSGIKNRFFGRAGETTPVVIGTTEAIFTITIDKE